MEIFRVKKSTFTHELYFKILFIKIIVLDFDIVLFLFRVKNQYKV